MMLLPPVQKIISEDNWLRSSIDGRYLLLRGVCFGPSAKLPPNLPFRSKEDWTKYETYIDLLLACGFTTLRMAFFWSALEPKCNPIAPEYNENYIQDFFYYVRLLAAKGFLIIIDLHQDLLGNAFGGSGMPDWVISDGSSRRSFLHDTPLWGLNYALNRDLRKTFTDFWNNDLTNRSAGLDRFKVRDRYLDMVERVAKEASAIDRVFGIEIFNEPHPAIINPKLFEEEILPEFYSGAISRIRKHSESLYAFLSPQSDWNVNVRRDRDYNSMLAGQMNDDRVIFAYHYYDSQLTALFGKLFHDGKREEYLHAQLIGNALARKKGMVPFLTEFGTRQNWMRPIVRSHMNWQFEAVEQSLVHATYWNVNLYNTSERLDGFMREDFSLLGYAPANDPSVLKPRNLDIATRPYAIAASARPVVMHFNLRSKEFNLVLKGKPLASPTMVYLPIQKRHPLQPIHYERGIEINYGGELRTALDGNYLSIWLDEKLELHEITIKAKV